MPDQRSLPESAERSRPTRREVLACVAGPGLGASLAGGVVAGASGDATRETGEAQDARFDPSVHGFGFPNWWGESGCAVLAEECPDGREFTVAYEPVSRDVVHTAITGEWVVDPAPEAVELLTRVVHSLAVRQLATSGHCYGMTLAAEAYFEDPSDLPAARESASDVPRPTGSYEPVGRRIRDYHANQLLDSAPLWLSLLALDLDRADPVASVEHATAALDETGTAALMFGGLANGHQVLAYDYEREDGTVRFGLYDPEFPAGEYGDRPYENPTSTIEVDADDGGLVSTIYGYEAWIYNEVTPGIGALDELTGGVDALLDRLDSAVWVSAGAGASLQVSAPDAATVLDLGASDGRGSAARSAGAPGDAVLVLDADPAAYEIEVLGDAGEYSLEVFGVRDGEVVVDEAVTDRFGESAERFELALEEAGSATLQRVESDVREGATGRSPDWPVIVGAGAGATVGLGLGYRYLARSRDDEAD